MEWFNPPAEWRAEGSKIHVTSTPNTDFWRKKPGGPFADNGHFYFQKISGDFAAEVKFTGQFKDQYDQAGLMIRLDEMTWLKCGIELYNGIQHASAVVTKTYSDWSIQPLTPSPSAVWMRVNRQDDTIEVSYSTNGQQQYHLIRQAYLTSEPLLAVGMMIATPLGSGFSVTFEDFSVIEPVKA